MVPVASLIAVKALCLGRVWIDNIGDRIAGTGDSLEEGACGVTVGALSTSLASSES